MDFINKKNKIVTGYQWFQNGDHPNDEYKQNGYEGKLVRRYRVPSINGFDICNQCGFQMQMHGWLDGTQEPDNRVCPGDWVMYEGNGPHTYKPKCVCLNAAQKNDETHLFVKMDTIKTPTTTQKTNAHEHTKNLVDTHTKNLVDTCKELIESTEEYLTLRKMQVTLDWCNQRLEALTIAQNAIQNAIELLMLK